jgi:L,D-peptidoglycan transpeptidase YkuD (ErfK/YbiS/YcfS/YnhG family)
MAPFPTPICRRPVLATAALVAGGLLPVGLGPPATAAPPATPLVDATVRQVVVVVTPSWEATTGRLAWFERTTADGWRRAAEPVQVTVGRAGLGWGLGLHPDPAATVGPAKREGDGRSPAGVFSIGIAFGAAPTLDTGLPYRPLDGDDWCVDVAASPFYNRIVGRRDVGGAAVTGSTELMRRDLPPTADGLYAVGFTIGHNPAALPGMGSCIFAHIRAGPGVPTAACTGFAEDDLRRLLAWLRGDARPLMVLLPAAEVSRLGAWGLPDAAFVTGDGP